MTKIPHIIYLDVQKHAKRQIVYMKQGDAMSRNLLVYFFNNGAVWMIPDDVTSVSLSYCKEDKVNGCYDHIEEAVAYEFNTGRTAVMMDIHPQVLTVAGNVVCELKLCDANAHVLNTFNFIINVEKSPHAMGQKSEGYWNNVFDGATFTPHISEDGVLSWTNDKDLPNPDPVQIDDGATFTPHVSDAGILSWTNDKGLPNPSPIDLKQFVVSPDDIPVVPMDIVTSADAVANVGSDRKIITPAGVKAIVDEYGGDAQNIKVFDLDDVSTTELYVLADQPKCAVFLAYNVANYTPDSEAETVVYPYENKLLLLPMTGCKLSPLGNYLQATFEQDADLVTYTAETPPVAVTVRKTVRVTVQSGASVGDPDIKTVEIVPTRLEALLPEPIVLTLRQGFRYDALAWNKNKTYAADDYFYNNEQASSGNIGFPHLYVCANAFTGDGTSLSARISVGDVTDLGAILSLPAGLTNMSHYAEAIERGNVKMIFGNTQMQQYQSASDAIICSTIINGANRTVTIKFDAQSKEIARVMYAVSVLGGS